MSRKFCIVSLAVVECMRTGNLCVDSHCKVSCSVHSVSTPVLPGNVLNGDVMVFEQVIVATRSLILVAVSFLTSISTIH